jgi:group II intron reverse transcriptase/maturase
MKHGSEKSDARVVAAKSANKSEKSEAESMEPRRATKENMDQTPKSRTQCREIEVSGLERVRQRSKSQPKERMTTLMHHLTVEALWSAYDRLKRNAAPGVDGVTWQEYGEDLIARLTELHQRLQSNRYRPQPSRRVYIAKADGRQRPLGIAALEDKIVQGAVVDVLNAIYEPAFKGYSHGFRPGRNPHQALDALAYGIRCLPVNWIIDADIASFFDTVNHDWLQRFLEHRIADWRLLRLIKLWLEAGVLEAGRIIASEEGTPQGAVISPVLANIYLHYVFDLWADRWRQRNARGQVILVRYADDIVIGFEHEWEARRFLAELRERMESFSLKLHPDKTRLLEFGRHAMARRARSGQGKPETFNFLGFTHICGRSRRGNFLLIRQTRRDRMRAKLRELKTELRKRMHHPIPAVGKWLGQVVRGYFQYHAVPTNGSRLSAFRYFVGRLWWRTLRRRSQRDGFSAKRLARLVTDWLPPVRILHPWPEARFAVNHPR